MKMTSLRATQLFALYEYVDGWLDRSGICGTPFNLKDSWRKQKFHEAVKAVKEAEIIVSERESAYRVPVERIAGWRTNPTAYCKSLISIEVIAYAYLWTVHSLFYFYRDLGKAWDGSIDAFSPCYLNIINPIDVAFGEGIVLNATEGKGVVFLNNTSCERSIG